jgi:hypothetical protein
MHPHGPVDHLVTDHEEDCCYHGQQGLLLLMDFPDYPGAGQVAVQILGTTFASSIIWYVNFGLHLSPSNSIVYVRPRRVGLVLLGSTARLPTQMIVLVPGSKVASSEGTYETNNLLHAAFTGTT